MPICLLWVTGFMVLILVFHLCAEHFSCGTAWRFSLAAILSCGNFRAGSISLLELSLDSCLAHDRQARRALAICPTLEVVWGASCCFRGGCMSSRQQNVCQEDSVMAVSILLAYYFPSLETKCAWKGNSYQCLHLIDGETRHAAAKWLSRSHPPGRWQGWE